MLSQGAVWPKGLVIFATEFPRVKVGCCQCLELKGSFGRPFLLGPKLPGWGEVASVNLFLLWCGTL